MDVGTGRALPRPFEMHWGGGMIVEEASVATPFHEPTIQLMQFDDGSLTLRFCYYHGSHFGRGPMMISEEFLPALAESLAQCPRTLALLRGLVEAAG